VTKIAINFGIVEVNDKKIITEQITSIILGISKEIKKKIPLLNK